MIKKLINAIMVTILIMIGGLTPAFIISLFVVIFTDITMKECVEAGPFWVFTVVFTFIFAIFASVEE